MTKYLKETRLREGLILANGFKHAVLHSVEAVVEFTASGRRSWYSSVWTDWEQSAGNTGLPLTLAFHLVFSPAPQTPVLCYTSRVTGIPRQ